MTDVFAQVGIVEYPDPFHLSDPIGSIAVAAVEIAPPSNSETPLLATGDITVQRCLRRQRDNRSAGHGGGKGGCGVSGHGGYLEYDLAELLKKAAVSQLVMKAMDLFTAMPGPAMG